MSGIRFCTDCGSWSESVEGRCPCGSGRIVAPPAGYRILAPGELDPVTIEQCAEVVETFGNGRTVYPDGLATVGKIQLRRDAAAAIRALKDSPK